MRRNFICSDYDQKNKLAQIYDNKDSKPKKSDIRAIRSVITASNHPLPKGTELTVVRWGGGYVSVSVDVFFRKSGEELLDRIEHTYYRMFRKKESWELKVTWTETEYIDYRSLLNKKADVPKEEEEAIEALSDAIIQAQNEEDFDTLFGLLNPDNEELIRQFKSEVQQRLESKESDNYDSHSKKLSSVIVSYKPQKAMVYTVISTVDLTDSFPYPFEDRRYLLMSFVQLPDGAWYWDQPGDTLLDWEVLKDGKAIPEFKG